MGAPSPSTFRCDFLPSYLLVNLFLAPRPLAHLDMVVSPFQVPGTGLAPVFEIVTPSSGDESRVYRVSTAFLKGGTEPVSYGGTEPVLLQVRLPTVLSAFQLFRPCKGRGTEPVSYGGTEPTLSFDGFSTYASYITPTCCPTLPSL